LSAFCAGAQWLCAGAQLLGFKTQIFCLLRRGAKALRRGAIYWDENPVFAGICAGAPFPVSKWDFTKLIQKSFFPTQKHLFESNNSYNTDTKHVYG
jgi:hypothetical protein